MPRLDANRASRLAWALSAVAVSACGRHGCNMQHHLGGQPRSSVSQLRQANPKVGALDSGAADVRAGAGNVRRLSPFADHRAHDLLDANGFLHQARKLVRQQREPEGSQAAQVQLAKVITSDRAPTKTKLEAQVASKLNQLRDTNFRPR